MNALQDDYFAEMRMKSKNKNNHILRCRLTSNITLNFTCDWEREIFCTNQWGRFWPLWTPFGTPLLTLFKQTVEFSGTCQCSICCVKVIHWLHGILERSSALETRTTTCGQARVQWSTKVPGGTASVVAPTWTATTTTPAATHRRTRTVWSGGTGRAGGTRWDSLKLKSDRFNMWIEWQHFVYFPLMKYSMYFVYDI